MVGGDDLSKAKRKGHQQKEYEIGQAENEKANHTGCDSPYVTINYQRNSLRQQ